MATTLTHQLLPSACIIVQQQGWTFQASIVRKRAVQHQRWCKSLMDLVDFVNYCQILCQDGPVYLKCGQAFEYEPLSYERAVELERAELGV